MQSYNDSTEHPRSYAPGDPRSSVQSAPRSRANRVAISALFASLALIFSYIEAIVPAATAIPGIKLGIANLVVIIAVVLMIMMMFWK